MICFFIFNSENNACMKKLTLFLFIISIVACRKDIQPSKTVTDFAATITAAELRQHLFVIASAEMEGRNTPSPGLEKAADYIIAQYRRLGVQPGNNNSYRQTVQLTNGSASNIIGIVEGTEKKDECVIISAHYDHVGVINGNIYYGADDNGSGTVSLLEIADAFTRAKKEGFAPKRTMVFLHFYGEEKGLWGSDYYVNNPVFPLGKTSANLNIDMIGRIATDYQASADSANYLYLIGDSRMSTQLNPITDSINNRYTKLHIDRKYDAPADPNRVFYRSDQYHFARKGVPVLFYFDGFYPDYHTPADTPDKIRYELMSKRLQLIFYTAWDFANRELLLKRDIPFQ